MRSSRVRLAVFSSYESTLANPQVFGWMILNSSILLFVVEGKLFGNPALWGSLSCLKKDN